MNERLEEIREHEIIADNECGEYERHKVDFYYEHVGWLIEQSERVEELERELERIKVKYRVTKESHYNCSKSTSEREQQNERYREALEKLTDESLDLWDAVFIAREALNESEYQTERSDVICQITLNTQSCC